MEIREIPVITGFESQGDDLVPAAIEVEASDGENYENIIQRISLALTDLNPWDSRPWQVLRHGQPDHPVNRAIGFWKRFGSEFGNPAEALELTAVSDDRVRRAAAYPLNSAAETEEAIANQPLKFHPFQLVFRSDEKVEPFLPTVLDTPWGVGYQYFGALAAKVERAHGCLLFADESAQTGEPALILTGGSAEVEQLRHVLDPAT